MNALGKRGLYKENRKLADRIYRLRRENKELGSRLEQAENANQDPYIAVLEAEIEELRQSPIKGYERIEEGRQPITQTELTWDELNNYKQACKSLGEEVARLRGGAEAPGLTGPWERKYYQLKVSSELQAMHEKQFLESANHTISRLIATREVVRDAVGRHVNVCNGYTLGQQETVMRVFDVAAKGWEVFYPANGVETQDAPGKPNSCPIDTAPKTEAILVSNGLTTCCAYWDYEDWCAPYSGGNSIGFTPDRWCRMPDITNNDDLADKNAGL